MNKALLLAIPLVFQGISAQCQTPNDSPQDWTLTFSDDFSNGVDPAIWRVRNDYSRDAQVYRDVPNNVRTENNNLILECHKETYLDQDYTSGRIDLHATHRYGFFEIKCKMPDQRGMWPAFWFTHAPGVSWPPEIDIFETKGSDVTFTSGGIWERENGVPSKTYGFEDFNQSIDQWHTYAIEWNRDLVHWYVDDQLIATTTKDVSNIDMTLSINLAVFPWRLPLPSFTSAKMEVEYVKIWRRNSGCNEMSWKEEWISPDANQVAGWNINTDDRHVVGDFGNNGKDAVLFINDGSNYARVYNYANGAWSYNYSNSGSGSIAGWVINSDDQYVSGDFDNDGSDEVLFINPTSGYARLYHFNNSSWSYNYSNSGSGVIGGWVINSDDKYVAGDFDNDNIDEILFINPTSGYARVYDYSNGTWSYNYSNSGSGSIAGWAINSDDRLLVGNFDSDNADEVLFINHTSNYFRRYNFNGSSWSYNSSNSGSGLIQNWQMSTQDVYLAGDFDNDGDDDILLINPTTQKSEAYSPQNWDLMFENHGNTNIYNWNLRPTLSDQSFTGSFDVNSPSQVFMIRNSGVSDHNFTPFNNSIKAKIYEFTECHIPPAPLVSNTSSSNVESSDITVRYFNEIIDIQMQETGNHQFEILDLSGRVITQHQLNGNSQISMTNLPSGVYLYRILANGTIVDNGKVLHAR